MYDPLSGHNISFGCLQCGQVTSSSVSGMPSVFSIIPSMLKGLWHFLQLIVLRIGPPHMGNLAHAREGADR
jgi:hypothetical protein